MAQKLLMTWVPESRRWRKKHKGKFYAVSCKQLGCPETKAESWRAANAWWEQTEAELRAKPAGVTEQDRKANAVKIWSIVQDWEALDEVSREKLVDSLLGAGRYGSIKSQAEAVVEQTLAATPPERAIKAQVAAWGRFLRGVCQSGQMSEGRYDAYLRNIRVFVAWAGPDTPIDAIDEGKLEGYFTHLSLQIGAGKYSATYCHTLMMTAKQFISRLAELKLIPLPGNIRSRRLRFNHSAAKKIETFTVAELRALLSACEGFSERTKLYLLLMLNCGMYQNDIAELLKEEVDFTRGTVTRARSKTRERHGPVVTYKLWPETFSLLQKLRAEEGELALTTDEGNPLVKYWVKEGGEEDGELGRYDVIQSAWSRLRDKMKTKPRLPMKHLRKTGASLLATHAQYKFYANHYLADSPKSIADKHYVVPSEEEFFSALDWLRRQFLCAE